MNRPRGFYDTWRRGLQNGGLLGPSTFLKAPSNLVLTDLTPNTHNWQLTWTDTNNGELGHRVYAYLQCSDRPIRIAEIAAGTNSYLLGTAWNSFAPLRFFVVAFHRENESPASNSVDAAMAAPTNLAINLDGANPYLTWNPSTTS